MDERYSSVAEVQLLGSIMMDPSAVIPYVRGTVKVGDFERDQARYMYKAICEMTDAKENIDYATVMAWAYKKHDETITPEFMETVYSYALTTATAETNAKLIHQAAVDRETRNIGMSIVEGDMTAYEAIEALNRIVTTGQGSRVQEPIDACEDFLAYWQDTLDGKVHPFLSTGYKNLDTMLGGGFISSGLIVLAARPGCGKTAVALSIADNIATSTDAVLYESLEMSTEQLWTRRIARMTGISASDIQRGIAGTNDKSTMRQIENAALSLMTKKLYIKAAAATIEDIEMDMRGIKNLKLLIIDHIGLVRSENTRESRYEAMTRLSHRLKQIAISTGIPILALCQLNRAGVGTATSPPTMNLIRDTGAIEEDSDAVILAHRPDYYLPKEEQPKPWTPQELNLIVDKNRHASTGRVEMSFTPMTMDVKEV